MVVVVVVTPEISEPVVTTPTESEVETPLRVDAGSTTIGVVTVAECATSWSISYNNNLSIQ